VGWDEVRNVPGEKGVLVLSLIRLLFYRIDSIDADVDERKSCTFNAYTIMRKSARNTAREERLLIEVIETRRGVSGVKPLPPSADLRYASQRAGTLLGVSKVATKRGRVEYCNLISLIK